jgi:hypothetical protein
VIATQLSNLPTAHLGGDVISLADRKRHDGERWILAGARCELTAVRDEQIRNIVRLTELVAHPILRPRTHPRRAKIVCRRIGWYAINGLRARRVVHGRALLDAVLTHRLIIGMVVKVHVRDRQAVLILNTLVEGNSIGRAGHVLANNPHAPPCMDARQLRA